MYYEGEGEDRKPVFEVGDDVRINDQSHAFCGFYGIVIAASDDVLTIEKEGSSEEDSAVVLAGQSQVEAN